MTQAIFHPAARQELEEAIDHYNAERQGLGQEFREEVQRILALLSRFPQLGQPVRGSVRRVMLSRFPYHISTTGFSNQTIFVFWLSHTIVEGQSTGEVGNRALTTACRWPRDVNRSPASH